MKVLTALIWVGIILTVIGIVTSGNFSLIVPAIIIIGPMVWIRNKLADRWLKKHGK